MRMALPASRSLIPLVVWSACVAVTLAVPAQERPRETWPQWGGPRQDFTSMATGLATSWPAAGPPRLWSRALGEGHSAISADDTRLYTIYRPLVPNGHADEEVIAALDARTGATIWEHRFASPTAGVGFGPYVGPHSTPLVTIDRVYAAGSRKQLFALDKVTGRVVWSHDLIREYGAPQGDRGYAASPLLHAGLLIAAVGGSGQSLAAFNAATGALVWKSGRVNQSPASPILIEFGGRPHVVYLGGNAVAGFNPLSGEQLWLYPHSTSASLNISTPLWSRADSHLFISAGYGTGSRLLDLKRRGAATIAVQRWANHRIRVHFSNAVRVGQFIVGSSGDFGPMFLTAVHADTGDIAWQDRTFSRAQLLVVDGKLLILDEDGRVGLAHVSSTGLQIVATARLLESIAWTPPTLVGTRMFVRDRKTIAAYELGR